MNPYSQFFNSLDGAKNKDIYGCETPEAATFYLSLYALRPCVVLLPDQDLKEIDGSLKFFNPKIEIHHLPALDPWFPTQNITMSRIRWFYEASKASSEALFLCSKKSLYQKTCPVPELQRRIFHLKPGGRLPDQKTLEDLGYIEVLQVRDPGVFSKKGFILDIFSPAHDLPIRIESIGDQIEKIYHFERQRGLNLNSISSAVLLPLHEVSYTKEFRFQSVQSLQKHRQEFKQDETFQFYLKKLSKNIFFQEAHLLAPFYYDQPGMGLDFFKKDIRLFSFYENESDLNIKKSSASSFQEFLIQNLFFEKIKKPEETFNFHKLIYKNKNIWPDKVVKKIKKPFKDLKPQNIFIATPSENQQEQFKNLVSKEGLKLKIVQENQRNWTGYQAEQIQDPSIIHLIPSFLPHHLYHHQNIFIRGDLWLGKIYSSKEVPASSYFPKAKAFRFSEIRVGDLVVDKKHGVGAYRGLKTLTVDGGVCEYIELEYRGQNRLYIPAHDFHRLFLFKSQLGEKALDQLGSGKWAQSMARAQRSIDFIILDLLELYQARTKIKRTPFKDSTYELDQFEKDFEFEETKDQIKTIKEVFEDMKKPYPMDRMIIGDSGFGKTEVAMRAAFKAVESARQVAFLAPTTILSLQHFESFKKRFHPYPMKVELINRFVSSFKIKEILKDLFQGRVDILIGSHRLLSSDVQFKNLGLLIIDEEHRFGVHQKERLKKTKVDVDLISMSATPIPRTLNMSLSGAKNISLIYTPPKNRRAPQVLIIHYEKIKIKEAIQREVLRGGQVIFIHNKIQSLNKIYNQLKGWLPDIEMKLAHGQMNEKDLEKNVVDFFKHEYPLLLCTTIVETGMDFARAGTIIINDAQNLGLAQLYQLRGRVGRRANISSYCYLVIPQNFNEPSASIERLNFLQTHSHLSSGYQVARYDLEMRGGGEFLGSQQSGHIQSIGYDLYLEMLETSAHPKKSYKFETQIRLPWTGYIPSSYIGSHKLRLMYYKYLSDLEDESKVSEFEDELRSCFGPLPKEVQTLIGQFLIRRKCQELKIKELKILKNFLYLDLKDSKKKLKLPKDFSWTHVYDLLNS